MAQLRHFLLEDELRHPRLWASLQQYTSLYTLLIRNTSYENIARIPVNIPAAARQVTLRGILPEEIHLVGPDHAACVFHLDSDAPNILAAAVNLS
jgi:hypothetical protein